jgi:3-deoxy-D-manno-octulosonic-acid transferase
MIRSVALLVYSLLFTLLAPLLKALAWANPKLSAQFAGRESLAKVAAELARRRAPYRHCVLFYCSSAGEFEQAKPLIERLEKHRQVFVHVLLFSRSGFEYLKVRKDPTSASLTPLTDSVWTWGWLLSALRPTIIGVVRHELWPGFLATAKQFGRLDLIDASQSLGESSSWLKRRTRAAFLRTFEKIYAVTDEDARFFDRTYRLPAGQLRVAGDTKYDRVRERAVAKESEIAGLRARFAHLAAKDGSHRARLIIGSSYFEEIDLLLAARAKNPEEFRRWQIILAPHHLQPENLAAVKERFAKAGVTLGLFSANTPGEFVLLDAMGILAEAYGTADAAFVGGALHNEVHNVLEPACHGLALAFGPFYKNSQEASHLVRTGLATVVNTPEDLLVWLEGLSSGGSDQRARMVEAVTKLSGASDRILADWLPLLER